MPKIETFDSEGKPNGWVLPVWSELDQPVLKPAQVYLTAIAPMSRKGPHLHMKRRGMFSVIAGAVRFQMPIRDGSAHGTHNGYTVRPGDPVVVVPAGCPCALYNYGDTEALVLNMPNPSWSQDNPDEWPVTHWQDPADWKVQS